jgi:putative glycosyltransferase (TIGR04372 family)
MHVREFLSLLPRHLRISDWFKYVGFDKKVISFKHVLRKLCTWCWARLLCFERSTLLAYHLIIKKNLPAVLGSHESIRIIKMMRVFRCLKKVGSLLYAGKVYALSGNEYMSGACLRLAIKKIIKNPTVVSRDDYKGTLELLGFLRINVEYNGILEKYAEELYGLTVAADREPRETRIVDCDCKGKGHPYFVITIACSLCGEQFSFTPATDLVPYKSPDPTAYPCPHCLGQLIWDSTRERLQIWKIYKEYKIRSDVYIDDRSETEYAQKAVTLAQALAPIALIRFGAPAFVAGHMVLEVNRFYSGKKLRLYPSALDLYSYDNGKIINPYVTHLWDRVFYGEQFDEDMQVCLSHLAVACASLVPCDSPNRISQDGFEIKYPNKTILPWKFTRDEHIRAHKALAEMGVPAGAKFACLLCRDGEYNKIHMAENPKAYHLSHRNADINTYRSAMEFLVGEGWYVLRMGSRVAAPLQWEGAGIIDYAEKFRTPFLDAYLFALCGMCVTTATGFDIISQLCHRPTVFTNYLHNYHCNPAYGPSVLINKHIWLEDEHRELSLDEYMKNTRRLSERIAGWGEESLHDPKNIDIRVIDNSSDEILDAVKECLEILEGKDSSTKEDQVRQRLVWSMKSNPVRGFRHPLARYGRLYLRSTPLFPPK